MAANFKQLHRSLEEVKSERAKLEKRNEEDAKLIRQLANHINQLKPEIGILMSQKQDLIRQLTQATYSSNYNNEMIEDIFREAFRFDMTLGLLLCGDGFRAIARENERMSALPCIKQFFWGCRDETIIQTIPLLFAINPFLLLLFFRRMLAVMTKDWTLGCISVAPYFLR